MPPKILLGAFAAMSCSIYDSSLLDDLPAGANHGGGAGDTSRAGTAGEGGVPDGEGGTPEAGAGGAGRGGTGPGEGGEGGALGDEAGAAGEAATGGASGSGSGTAGIGGATGGGAGVGGASGASGNAGTGGAGAGGAGAGGAGAGGAGAGGAGAGGAGAGGTAGGEPCPTGGTGCARLSVPLSTAGDRTLFSIALGAATDFSNAVISYRVYKAAGTGGRIWAYVQHGGNPDYNLIYGGARNFDAFGGWQTLTWDVATSMPGFTFDKSIIYRLGIEIVASGSGPWTDPTVVYIDSISVTSGPSVGPWPFDDATSVSSAGTAPSNVLLLSGNASELVPGSTLDWAP